LAAKIGNIFEISKKKGKKISTMGATVEKGEDSLFYM
jgi:hypothetical protein